MAVDDLLRMFRLEPVTELETPVPLVDVDVALRNLTRWQKRCEELGLANRPHIKTHKLAGFAKAQVALGAKGITVQKLGEAEAMAAAGLDDMLLTFNVVGEAKLKRLAVLRERVNIKVVADNAEVVAGLARAAAWARRDIEVLVECDTGAARNGVQSPEAAKTLAQSVAQTPGLRFGGLMTYPKPGARNKSDKFLREAKDLIGMVPCVSTGGSPDMWKDEGLAEASEYRAGTYIYFDRSLVERGACTWEDCALSVLATVVSTPTPERAMIDAGSKSLTSDLLGMKGYGVVPALGFAPVYDLSEEHGFIDVSKCETKPRVGDRVRIVPNHACPVTNLFDKVVLVQGEKILGAVKVDARGTVQ